MKRSRCFIVQEPMKRDFTSGAMVPVMDFRKVIDYGDPVVLLPTGRIGFTPGPMVDTIREKIKSITADDYVVPTGDPSAIFATAMIVSELCNGQVNVLKWDRVRSEYVCVKVDIHHRTRKEN